MIESIYLENILNFKGQFDLDFSVKATEGVKHNSFMFGKSETTVNAFNVIYGKNNFGKTNLLKVISSFCNIIYSGGDFRDLLNLKTRDVIDKESEIQFVILSEENQYRYAVRFDSKKIIDEWLFVKLNNSSRETKIFDRSENFYSKELHNRSVLSKMKLKNDKLIINCFNNLNESIINNFFNNLKDCIYISSHEKIVLRPEILDFIIENPKLIDIISKEMNNIDVDVKRVEIKKYDEEYLEWFKETFINDGATPTADDLERIRHSGLPHFGFNRQGKEDSYSIDFISNQDVVFTINEVSFGTKSFFNILSTTLAWLNKDNPIILIDEIEAGLHFELLLKLLEIIERDLKGYAQVIVATHAPIVLDQSYISKDSKILLKNINGNIEADYVSNYGIKREHKISRRYELNAFETSPEVV